MTKDEALKLALEWAETHGEAVFAGGGISAVTGMNEWAAAVKEVLAQPEQEPVAWAIYDKRGGSKLLFWPENHLFDGDATRFYAVPLYAAPPKREWVGLTKADCKGMSLCDKVVAIWTERLLKEKNT